MAGVLNPLSEKERAMSGYHLGVYQVGECVVDLHENGDAYSGTIYADPTVDPADRVL